jgi:2-C-methyl-D-erythritol 4-phosphate cytidylyltransferase
MANDTAIILLAGGHGSRFGGDIPKQFIKLEEKPVVFYSLELFLNLEETTEVVIVCSPPYRSLFPSHPRVSFALPGTRRQDSVFNGIQALKYDPKLVLIHDAARPLITKDIVLKVIEEARLHGAAAVGVPIKFTIKEHTGSHFVQNTLDRSHLWEVQTPQVIRSDLLYKGFQLADEKKLTVTDDVSLVELLKKPVKLVEGSYANLKITTPEDMILAKHLLQFTHG